jgi:hypothetical protein
MVGSTVGSTEGAMVGSTVGSTEGATVGATVSSTEGSTEGTTVSSTEGSTLGVSEGEVETEGVTVAVGTVLTSPNKSLISHPAAAVAKQTTRRAVKIHLSVCFIHFPHLFAKSDSFAFLILLYFLQSVKRFGNFFYKNKKRKKFWKHIDRNFHAQYNNKKQ